MQWSSGKQGGLHGVANVPGTAAKHELYQVPFYWQRQTLSLHFTSMTIWNDVFWSFVTERFIRRNVYILGSNYEYDLSFENTKEYLRSFLGDQ